MPVEQYKEWRDYYLRNPWGPYRDDMRQTAFLAILMSAMSGKESEFRMLYPYCDPQIDIDAALKQAAIMERSLESDGKGGHRWKGGAIPDGIRNRS